jgi:hypothetical protein
MAQGSTAIYLLIYEDDAQPDIEADLKAEVEVQLGSRLTIGPVSELLREDDGVRLADVDPIRVLRIDRWSSELIGLLDTHVIRLERTGAQFLFLTTDKLSEQLLVAAPNFRNRLTEVLRIVPDDPSGGALN